MIIYGDNNPMAPSIAISGDAEALLNLGRAFLGGEEISIKGDKTPSRFYPVVMDELVYIPAGDQNDELLNIATDGKLSPVTSKPASRGRIKPATPRCFIQIRFLDAGK